MKTIALMATMSLSFQAFAAINTTFFPSLDVKSIHNEELSIEKNGEAPRFAVPHSVSINPAKMQNWEKSAQGFTWSHRVTAPNAVSLNFGFTKFHLPEGAELNIYSADRTQFIRAFTHEDNNVNNALWTPVIMTDDALIELTVPSHLVSEVQFELGHIGQGFRTFGQSTEKSGSCNVDVACSDSAGWENEVNSVAVISTGGSRFCTGFMVNNTNNDKTPYFMTANHCRINAGNAASLVTYWNYQKSTCRGAREAKLTQFNTGAVHLASYPKSDATLVKLTSQPKPEWNVNYAGWDASGVALSPVTAIHHPNVDEKSISFDYDAVGISNYGVRSESATGTHVWVKDWDVGTTEPGSSGSPLFDANHRVIGQLHGGSAACGNDQPDWYGRFFVSFGEGGLKSHLDSSNTGSLTVDTI